MKNSKIFFWLGALILITGLLSIFLVKPAEAPKVEDGVVVCTADAMQCPDGSYVGRSGPNCEFVCPTLDDVSASEGEVVNPDIQIMAPASGAVVTSPLQLSGQAVGPWYFEASLPVEIRDWQGNVIAQSYVTATGDWMTVEVVPFTGEIVFVSPYAPGDAAVMKEGSIVFKKDNPSGLPEHDAEIIVPIMFAN